MNLCIAVVKVTLEKCSLLSVQIPVLTSTHRHGDVSVEWSEDSLAPLVVEQLSLGLLLSSMAAQSRLQLLSEEGIGIESLAT